MPHTTPNFSKPDAVCLPLILSLLSLLFISTYSLADDPPPEVIKVGIYPFEPFVEYDGESQYSGMTLELLEIINQSQGEFFFTPVPVSPKRRYQGYEQGDFDALFYENKTWGWQEIDIQASDVYQSGGERYIALRRSGRDQSYFDQLENKRMLGILGFHYGFADFNADEEFLQKKFNMTLTWSNEQNLKLLTASHGDIAVITEAYLRRYLRNNPRMRQQLIISDRYDQIYSHSVLLRPGLTLTLDKLNQLLERIKLSDEFITLTRRYGFEARR